VPRGDEAELEVVLHLIDPEGDLGHEGARLVQPRAVQGVKDQSHARSKVKRC
jgi:hypothetical protein